MHHQPVSSSSIASIGYDPINKIMEVKYFGSGQTHSYHGVDHSTWVRTVMAKSVGKYVENSIKPHYRNEKVS